MGQREIIGAHEITKAKCGSNISKVTIRSLRFIFFIFLLSFTKPRARLERSVAKRRQIHHRTADAEKLKIEDFARAGRKKDIATPEVSMREKLILVTQRNQKDLFDKKRQHTNGEGAATRQDFSYNRRISFKSNPWRA
jgi:hypothetical protein